MSKNKVLIPELRFPEFMNEGSWTIEELGQVSEIVRGGSPRPIQDYLTTRNDGLNWLKIADVSPDSKYITGTKEKVIKEALSSTREVNPGDLILSNSMSFGRPYISKIKACIHDGWIAIRKISKKTFEDYLYYFILSEASQEYFRTKAAGAAVKNLNADIIKLLAIHLPKNKKEQQKIAACLSSLDEVIVAQKQNLELLKDHKKGLLQNIFPQEGEKVPKYRFPEFRKDGIWVERSLREIATFVNEKTPLEKLSIKTYISTENILPNFAGVISSSKLPGSGTFTKYIKGDILISNIRPYLRKIWFSNREGACSNDVFVIRAKQEINEEFLSFLLMNDDFVNYVMIGAKGVKMPRGDKDLISKYPILFPKGKVEQQRIASCLSSLDSLIAAQTEKIEQLNLHKKGLMQVLFPKTD